MAETCSVHGSLLSQEKDPATSPSAIGGKGGSEGRRSRLVEEGSGSDEWIAVKAGTRGDVVLQKS